MGVLISQTLCIAGVGFLAFVLVNFVSTKNAIEQSPALGRQ